jgi:hypothetical protein
LQQFFPQGDNERDADIATSKVHPMTIDASCPNCGTLYTVRRELIGKRTKCTRCGAHFVIAEAPASAPPPGRESAPSPQEAFTGIPTHLPPPAHAATPTAPPPRPERTGELFGFESNPPQPRFPAMRMVARAYEIMAVVVLAIAAMLLLVFFVAVIRDPSAWLAAMLSSGLMFATAFVTALMSLFAAQAIRLGLQIEQNTRESAQACRQLAEHLGGIQLDK